MPQNIYNKFSDFEDNEQILLNENKGDWSEDNIKKLLTNIIEDKYVEDVAKSLIKFRQEASNYDTECALAFDSKFKQIGELIVSSGRGDVNLPKETIDEAGEDGFGMVMHSHTSEVPLPSAGDIETGGLNLKVKYNFIVTQDNGFAILKNKDFNKIRSPNLIKKYDDKSEEIIKGWNDATENYKQELISENESTIVIPLKTKIFRNDYKKASFERNSKELHALVFDEGFDIYYKNP